MFYLAALGTAPIEPAARDNRCSSSDIQDFSTEYQSRASVEGNSSAEDGEISTYDDGPGKNQHASSRLPVDGALAQPHQTSNDDLPNNSFPGDSEAMSVDSSGKSDALALSLDASQSQGESVDMETDDAFGSEDGEVADEEEVEDLANEAGKGHHQDSGTSLNGQSSTADSESYEPPGMNDTAMSQRSAAEDQDEEDYEPPGVQNPTGSTTTDGPEQPEVHSGTRTQNIAPTKEQDERSETNGTGVDDKAETRSPFQLHTSAVCRAMD